MLGKILTGDNLKKRNWPHNPMCCLCNAQRETPVHLLAGCPFTISLWGKIMQKCNLPSALVPSPGCENIWDCGTNEDSRCRRSTRQLGARLCSSGGGLCGRTGTHAYLSKRTRRRSKCLIVSRMVSSIGRWQASTR